METIVGLFCDTESAQEALQKLQEAGFPKDKVNLITQESGIRKLLENCDCRSHFMAKCVWGMATLGLIVAAPLGFVISLLLSATLELSWGVELLSALIVTASGAALGATFGCFFGADAEEGEIYQCCRQLGAGGQAVAILVSHHQGEVDAWRILDQARAEDIKTLDGVEERVFASLASNDRPIPLYS